MSAKWSFNSKVSFSNKNFAAIYKFYVLETPVDGVSARGIPFKKIGCNMTSLNAALKRTSPFLKDHWFSESQKNIESVCTREGILNEVDFTTEFVIHTLNEKLCSGKTDSMFYAIRCAFAHGSFGTRTFNKEKYYMLENRDAGKLKARMLLKEATLLEWIKVVNSAPAPDKHLHK